ncbi:hypothetical protein [Rubripirellula reticaptiva]|uniref:TIGR03790 family protein n=1 Tax=Rubripirellula reticaptiva TaxID=2528013 RepID=A0A5C6ERE1_9BACT|nr:hypothetical protein [Rubripirellula reticaptiva]TWU51185.1 hypothetical protein Poly59_27760 [Rubripirellula reticaptiva]
MIDGLHRLYRPRYFKTTRTVPAIMATIALAFAFASEDKLMAGVGPENVIVVINADSVTSRTIANHYIDLRGIPDTNVVLLSDVPQGLRTNLADFKAKILSPLFAEIDARKIGSQVRVIAYSADFPTSVDVSTDTAKLTDPTLKQYQLPTASINGLTSLYQFLLGNSERYLDLGSNLYARGSIDREFRNPYMDKERNEAYDAAVANFSEKSYADAAKQFTELFVKTPSFSPIAIRAAEAYALAGETDSAKLMLIKSIQSGWRSRKYLDRNDALSDIVKSDAFQPLMNQLSDEPATVQGPKGFASELAWAGNGYPSLDQADGVRYMLSCMLAVVHSQGSTVDQAVEVLRRSSKCDNTFPDANFWFTKTGDVRTTTRFPGVADALLWLGYLGRPAGVILKSIPDEKADCVGLMLGTPTMQLAAKSFRFVPGAIADNLTSHGGNFETSSQTKLTELLHAGAAMSSGTVAEPFSLQPKFPLPMMYGYYASGVTAIEAFYLSLMSPYQLLIVGDPLAQPFARPPSDRGSLAVSDKINGEKTLRMTRKPADEIDLTRSTPTQLIEIFIDGKLTQRIPAIAKMEMGIKGGPPGLVEVRMAMIGNDPTQPRISRSIWLQLGDGAAPPKASVSSDGQTAICKYKNAESIDWMLYGQVVSTTTGPESDFAPDRSVLGEGPLNVRPVVTIDGNRIPGRPVTVGRK